jgi:vancomycin aglycone glucosyltransferase
MRVLLSTIGSRGDVQPLVGLAMQLKVLGQEVHLCVPPDFRDWIETLGFSVTPIGPELRKLTASSTASRRAPLTPEQRRQLGEASVTTQFETIANAARGCDAIVGATALQIGARSVAESMGIPYFFAAFCPVVLPSSHHAPPPLPIPGQLPASPTADKRELWSRDAERLSELFGPVLNSHRETLGLPRVADVRTHIFTDQPWLAADPTLGPWPEANDPSVFQSGAWLVRDDRPLSDEIEKFLERGEPPIYFGFGSMRGTPDLSQVMVESANAVGHRAIVSRGWADLSLVDQGSNCLAIDEVNHQALFKRVAAVVHHGGAGTTTAAARSGAPQVIIPQLYDQHYWAQRIDELGIGTAHAPGAPTIESLTDALRRSLEPDVAARARTIASAIRSDGTLVAAQRLIETVLEL